MNQLFDLIVNFIRELRLWVIVLSWEIGIRVRGGKHVANLHPGIHLKIPFLDEVRVHPSRLQFLNPPLLDLTTVDGKTMTLGVTVRFKIVDLKLLLDRVADPEDAISDMVSAYVTRYVREKKKDEFAPQALEAAAKKALVKELPGVAGLSVAVTTLVIGRTLRLIKEERKIFGSSAAKTLVEQ